jgi:hypothetical protein
MTIFNELTYFVVDAHHSPVALDEPPSSGHVDGVPAVPVGRVREFFTGQVTTGLAVSFNHLEVIIRTFYLKLVTTISICKAMVQKCLVLKISQNFQIVHYMA